MERFLKAFKYTIGVMLLIFLVIYGLYWLSMLGQDIFGASLIVVLCVIVFAYIYTNLD